MPHKKGPRIDLSGKKFHELSVISCAGIMGKVTNYRWLCKCTCGKTVTVLGSHLLNGHTKSCGCKNNKELDLCGKKINKWTVIRKIGSNSYSRDILWECQCECGTVSLVRASCLNKGHTKQCVECGRKTRAYTEDFSDATWERITRRAKNKKIPLSVSKKEAYALFLKQGKKCALSNKIISFPKTGKAYLEKDWTASLDRIDSKKGYIRGNIQWVHKHINRMKNIFSQDYFVETCKLISKNAKRLK